MRNEGEWVTAGKKECPDLDSLPAGLYGLQAGEEEGKEGGEQRDDWRETGISLEAGKVPGLGT